MTYPAGWAALSRPAKAYRVFHAAWSVAGLASLGYIWACAATRRRDRLLWASVAFLSIEGGGLIVGGGDCPMGPFQEQLGDPVPFFELVLPPRAAKAAVPILAGASIAGFLAVALRPPESEQSGGPLGALERPLSATDLVIQRHRGRDHITPPGP